jgi:tetratricopeptide (TPR) repeat protein
VKRCLGALLVFVFALAGACAPRIVPPRAVAPSFPDFVFPAVPRGVGDAQASARQERGWRFLQAGDPRNAEREFAAALRRRADFFPAEAGLGYAALAQGDYKKAVNHFDAALRRSSAYAPALVGRGDALLALGRPEDALASFEKAVAADASLSIVARRIEVLRFRGLQEDLAAARRAADTGRFADARAAYERAIASSPDSGFLYRDLGLVQRKQGDQDAALASFRKAVELDGSDSGSLLQIGEILEHRGDVPGAVEVLKRAADIDPNDALATRLEELTARLRLAELPPEYREIAASTQVTRGELAALIGVRFDKLLQEGRQRDVVLTDARAHWASVWILPVVRAGVMDAYPNHTFQPRAAVRRSDLALALSRLLNLLAARRPSLAAEWRRAQQAITDIPPRHLGYPAAALVVSAGVLPLFEGGAFQPSRPVTGAEAIDAVERVGSLIPRPVGRPRAAATPGASPGGRGREEGWQ